MSPRIIAVTIVMTVAALGSWYLARSDRSNDGDDLPLDAPHRGYYLKSARILGTGPDGSLLYEIWAQHAEQKEDYRIDFSDVLINYSPDSAVPWTINADSATIYQNQQRLVLRGHVRAVSSEGFSGSDTEIRTQFLELEPEKYIAETDQRVQIRVGERSITATGMLASLKENQLQLHSNVSGKFVP